MPVKQAGLTGRSISGRFFKSYRACSWTPEESQTERCEHQDNANIHCQPFPESVSEEHDIYTDYDGCHHHHVKHDSYLSAHFSGNCHFEFSRDLPSQPIPPGPDSCPEPIASWCTTRCQGRAGGDRPSPCGAPLWQGYSTRACPPVRSLPSCRVSGSAPRSRNSAPS